MNLSNITMVALISLLVSATALGDSSVSSSASLSERPALNRAEVGGLVVSQTITMNGREFYDRFAAAWAEKDESGRFTVTVTERPTARLGSQIYIDYGNRRMLQVALPTNRSQIPALSAEVASQVFQGILDYQLAQFFGDPDLGRDEL